MHINKKNKHTGLTSKRDEIKNELFFSVLVSLCFFLFSSLSLSQKMFTALITSRCLNKLEDSFFNITLKFF